MISGDYFFEDHLKYQFDNWDYCTGEDRRYYCILTFFYYNIFIYTDKFNRFYAEHIDIIKPSGAT
jgi:hypothetical protein